MQSHQTQSRVTLKSRAITSMTHEILMWLVHVTSSLKGQVRIIWPQEVQGAAFTSCMSMDGLDYAMVSCMPICRPVDTWHRPCACIHCCRQYGRFEAGASKKLATPFKITSAQPMLMPI
jgi:hypothetical protein